MNGLYKGSYGHTLLQLFSFIATFVSFLLIQKEGFIILLAFVLAFDIFVFDIVNGWGKGLSNIQLKFIPKTKI